MNKPFLLCHESHGPRYGSAVLTLGTGAALVVTEPSIAHLAVASQAATLRKKHGIEIGLEIGAE